jgi:hypothetical protein
MRELSVVEVNEVSGGMMLDSAKYFTASAGIGMAVFGPAWGGVSVGVAIAVAPIAVGAMAAFAFFGGIALARR